MLQDILNTPQTAAVEEKTYLFEFDHAAFAVLEKNTRKSVYEIYDTLIEKNALTSDDSLELLCAAMLKHHTQEEIMELKTKIEDYPGFLHCIKEALITSFVIPMMPPEILKEFCDSKKKVPMT